jgi:hypothetical protein
MHAFLILIVYEILMKFLVNSQVNSQFATLRPQFRLGRGLVFWASLSFYANPHEDNPNGQGHGSAGHSPCPRMPGREQDDGIYVRISVSTVDIAVECFGGCDYRGWEDHAGVFEDGEDSDYTSGKTMQGFLKTVRIAIIRVGKTMQGFLKTVRGECL